MFQIEQFLEKKGYSDDKRAYFEGFQVVDAIFHKQTGLVVLKIENDLVLPCALYHDLYEYLSSFGFENLKLYFKTKNQDLPLREFHNYLKDFNAQHRSFDMCVPLLKEDGGFSLSYLNEEDLEKDAEEYDDLKLFFYDLGYRGEIACVLKEEAPPKPLEKKPLPVKEETKKEFPKKEE
ncbi:MAG: hypothetical protein IIZ47_01635, partial [Erysipelotrichaceae bacterium]|nr:hypothetical protein [Erysipelotrichaceae bacterium]